MLTNRIALVTGSSRGLGRGIALTLASNHATVIVNYLNRGVDAEETVRRITSNGGQAWPFQADVTKPAQVTAMIEAITERFNRLDILVNNVGAFLWQDVVNQTEGEWRHVIESNLSSVFYCTRAAIPLMRNQNWGRIVNLGITGGQFTTPARHMAAYVAAKSGMIAFSKCVALEEARNGITVNVVCPGVIPDTERTLSQALSMRDDEVPVGRPGTWEDVGNAILFFLSEAASFVTGAVLEVNGGWTG